MPDIKELNDNVLEKVTGGFSVNADGTYTIRCGEIFSGPFSQSQNLLYEAAYDYFNVSLNSQIICNRYLVDGDGNLISEGSKLSVEVCYLLDYIK